MLVETLELAELRAKHHRYFTDENSLRGMLSQDFLFLPLPLTSLRIIDKKVVKYLFAVSHVSIDLSTVGQVSHARVMRKHRCHAVILLGDSRLRVHVHLAKLYLIDDVAVLTAIASSVFGPIFLTNGILRN